MFNVKFGLIGPPCNVNQMQRNASNVAFLYAERSLLLFEVVQRREHFSCLQVKHTTLPKVKSYVQSRRSQLHTTDMG